MINKVLEESIIGKRFFIPYLIHVPFFYFRFYIYVIGISYPEIHISYIQFDKMNVGGSYKKLNDVLFNTDIRTLMMISVSAYLEVYYGEKIKDYQIILHDIEFKCV